MTTSALDMLPDFSVQLNNKPQQQLQQQQQQPQPNQNKEAQDLYYQLQFLTKEGETPQAALDILSEALHKVQELSMSSSRQAYLEPDTRKTLEDISALLLSARQMAKNKGISDRLQIIAEESQKALNTGKVGVPSLPGKEMTPALYEFMNTWRPLFYLLISSRDFRMLILDSIRISRQVIYRYTDSISDETSEKFEEGESMEQIAESIKDQVAEKGTPELTEEEWDTIQDGIQRVLASLSKEPTYHQGIERIFTLLDMFQKTLQEAPDSKYAVLPKDIHLRRVVGETEELVSIFSGRETLEEFKLHLRNLIRKTRENENLHNYLYELKEWILKAKSESEIQSEEFKEKIKELANRGRELMQDFKDDDLRPFLDSANSMIDNIKNDEFLQILRHQAGIVQSDLSYLDNEGKLQMDTDMLTKLQKVLLPVLVDALKYIPVAKITSSDAYRDICLDKIVLCSYDIIPENIRFHLETDSEFSLHDVQVTGSHTYLVIELNRLRTELKDVEFYYKRKSFPTLEDSGRVTFRIKGDGAKLTLTYNLEQAPGDNGPRIMEGNANFNISDLDIEFDTSTIHHTLIIPMLTNWFKNQIKNQIEEQVERNLKSWIDKLGEVMTNTMGQANRPFLSGLEMARKTIKTSQFSEFYQKRREILE